MIHHLVTKINKLLLEAQRGFMKDNKNIKGDLKVSRYP